MTTYNFANLDQWAKKSKARMLAIAQTATQSVIDDAQRPVGKGGRMRVDTGFLRASGQASLSGLPTGPSRKGEAFGEQDHAAIIGQLQLGNSLWFGWTAEYAKYREGYDAFLALAVQNWQSYVNAAVAEGKRRFP